MNRPIFFFIFFFLISALFSTASAASLSVTGYAWSDTIGWIQMNPSLGGVTLNDATGDLNGYAWSDNIGWVNFDATDATHPSAIINNITTCGSACVVSGWAKAIAADGNGWDGWIKMRDAAAPAYSVNLDKTTGNFSGYAWGSDVVGWVSFGGVTLGSAPAPTLSVSLSANPSSGNPPLTSILTATVSGTAVGTINYKFDCTNDGIYEGIFNNVSDNPKTYSCTYDTTGTYTARVYVERDIAPPAENTTTITATAPTIPVAPTGLTVVAGTGANCEKIILNWTDNAINETSYEVARKIPGGIFSIVATLPANTTTYTDSGLTGGTTYIYRVRACNTSGCSAGSNQASATTVGCVAEKDFSLTSDNAILATINAGQGSLAVSNTALIKVVPVNGYNETVSLSSNISSVISGATDNFSKTTLNSSEYSAGSAFSVSIPPTTLAGLYVITVQGDGTTITGKTVNVNLNVEIYDINYCEPPWCPE